MDRVDWTFVRRYLGHVALTAFLLTTFMFVGAAPPSARRVPLRLLWDSILAALPIVIAVTVLAAIVLAVISARRTGR